MLGRGRNIRAALDNTRALAKETKVRVYHTNIVDTFAVRDRAARIVSVARRQAVCRRAERANVERAQEGGVSVTITTSRGRFTRMSVSHPDIIPSLHLHGVCGTDGNMGTISQHRLVAWNILVSRDTQHNKYG